MHKYLLVIIVWAVTCNVYASSEGGESATTPYFEIATPFVVNIQDETSMKFLQVTAQLRLSRPELKTQIAKNLPAIQNVMMLVLSEQTVKDIRTLAGKQKVREQTLKELQGFLEKEIGDPAIAEILFTSFIIQ